MVEVFGARQSPESPLLAAELLLETSIGLHELAPLLDLFERLIVANTELAHHITDEQSRTAGYTASAVHKHVCGFPGVLDEVEHLVQVWLDVLGRFILNVQDEPLQPHAGVLEMQVDG